MAKIPCNIGELTPLSCFRQAMNNPEAEFRDGQDVAIETLLKGGRLLVIQATGWGKSMVYFVSTKLRRAKGAGPTLLISPLLALMRNQQEAAERLGLKAAFINSANKPEWEAIFSAIKENRLDVLIVAPERLNNRLFKENFLELLNYNIGLLVIDEAHCISDWGHEFRPEYRRIREILPNLPASVPILATTATANKRVLLDIKEQLGDNLKVLRGSLVRKNLRLMNLRLMSRESRLAWLASMLEQIPGSGLIYAQTTSECAMIAAWLKSSGFAAEAYHAKLQKGPDPYSKEELEALLQQNKLKALVSTVALGMGFDKPDLAFVLHYQRPASVVHYYQQVGRAGRGGQLSFGLLAEGEEDDDLAAFFIENSGPKDEEIYNILHVFEEVDEALPSDDIADLSGISKEKSGELLNYLAAAPGAPILASGPFTWQKSPTFDSFRLDKKYQKRLKAIREAEVLEMSRYIREKGCLMAFMQRALGEENPAPCGKCYNCNPAGFPNMTLDGDLLAKAAIFRHKYYMNQKKNR